MTMEQQQCIFFCISELSTIQNSKLMPRGRSYEPSLGVYGELRKATVSFVTSVCLSILPHQTYFH